MLAAGQLAADVAVSCAAYSFDALYSYSIPRHMYDTLRSGARVLVPFGKGNIKRIGFVVRIYAQTDEAELKPISKILEEQPLINEELIKLVLWLKENTFCTYFDAYKAIVPAGFSYRYTQRYKLANMAIECELTPKEQQLVDALKNAEEPKDIDEILNTDEDAGKIKIIKSLIDKGVIEQEDDIKRRVGDETVKMVSLTDSFVEDPSGYTITPKQKKVVEFLLENSAASVKELLYATGVTQTIIKNLVKGGIAYEYEYESLRNVDMLTDGEELHAEELELNDEQQRAYNGISALVDAGKPCGALLYGVTGSGKTSVFIKLIEHTLSIGKTALVLIPEISLTPQTVGKFRAYFGDTVAVIHSNLSLGQRVDEYKRLKSGKAKIAVGTRSAVFAPLENIGIIIIDEEGEHSYKSESSPRYHARDVAIQRCGHNNATLLLASATPSLETYYYAKTGRFHYFELKKRFSGALLPEVAVVDMETEREMGCEGVLSGVLIDEITKTLERKEQAILLINRRGYSPHFTCRECRTVVQCPHCSIPLTYHKANGRLMCHYCGYSSSANITCQCGCKDFSMGGSGTQKIEDVLSEQFPNAKILRMDADTTSSRFAYEKNFQAFANGEYDIMLGTQMIAKGIDFPTVTLVGVLSIDNSLYRGDFRSSERTFSLITQVVGRGGRGEKRGRAFLQTSSPDHYVIELAARQDYKGFFEQEISFRKTQIYPPFCDLCIIGLSGVADEKVRAAAKHFASLLEKNKSECETKLPLYVLGPSQYSVGKVNNRYRYRLILKCKNNRATRKIISDTLSDFLKEREYSDIRIFADMNGDII